MTATVIAGWGTNPMAQKKWSAKLAADLPKKSYFGRKFMGEGDNFLIQRLTELQEGAGDRISFDLSVQLRGRPVQGDAKARGTEEALKFYSDEVRIDQTRHPVSAGGRMTRKRVAHDLRVVAKSRLTEYWARYFDELIFIYLSGSRGINQDFIEPLGWLGHAQNPIQPPDSAHIMYAGSATSKATLVAGDKMSRITIERAQAKAEMMQALDPLNANMVPLEVEGEPHFVTIMNPFQAYDMRTADTTGWLDIQKAAAAAEGKNNPIFRGGLGMINNTVLHSHARTIRFADYGAGANVPAARALFCGRQAGVIAYGFGGGQSRFQWVEEMNDYGNEPVVVAGTIVGIKKTQFNTRDFGVISIDAACANPNPT